MGRSGDQIGVVVVWSAIGEGIVWVVLIRGGN